MWCNPTAYERKEEKREGDNSRAERISALQESVRETRVLLKYAMMARMVPAEIERMKYSLPLRRCFGDLRR